MAHSKSARKRVRQSEAQRNSNRGYRSALRTQIKKFRAAVEAGDKSSIEALLRPTLSMIDKGSAAGVVHANAASRTKSRLSRAANRVASS